ncbi:hypothetical protein [Streptomyces hainanensis]|nr:hypothetical protein [Streptomyces hainanensis]
MAEVQEETVTTVRPEEEAAPRAIEIRLLDRIETIQNKAVSR